MGEREEAGGVHLHVSAVACSRPLTASRNSSASSSLPPGASNLERSSTLRSAHGRSAVVLAGRCHFGRGPVEFEASTATGMVVSESERETDDENGLRYTTR